MMKLSVLFAPVFVVFASLPAMAAPQVGVRLGSVQLHDVKDRDVVSLPACKGSSNQKVSKLSFKVSRYTAEIDSLKVVYQNGDHDVLKVKSHFLPNSTSRWIDLEGDKRCIAKIVVKGDTDTRRFRPRKQAKITFFGR